MTGIKRVSSERELAQAFALRLRVFVKEQGVPAEIELDRDDRRAVHLIARASDKVVGTARVVMHGRSAKIGRMAVLKSFRGRGIGRRLLVRAIATAMEIGAVRIYLHAQVAVLGFYKNAGFVCVGPVFDEAGIPHRQMIWQRASHIGDRAIRKRRRLHRG